MKVAIIGAVAAALAGPSASWAQVATASELKPYNVTVRRFDTTKGPGSGTDFVLPVDSPDAEHACASTLANASAFSRKVEGGAPLPIGFACVRIETR